MRYIIVNYWDMTFFERIMNSYFNFKLIVVLNIIPMRASYLLLPCGMLDRNHSNIVEASLTCM